MDGLIERFLSYDYGDGNGNGYGYGDGNGYGYGYGYGNGNGDGNGNGYGYGYGDGNGYGNGYGDGNGYGYGNGNGNGNGNGYGKGNGNGISEYNGKKVYLIDDVPTIIENIKGDIAKGYTLRDNVYLIPCYVAKCGGFFAHGETAKQALLDAQAKYDINKPLSERIADTIKKYQTLDTVVPNRELYSLHHILTGSCKFGRDEFIANHNINIEDSMTMRDFIELTKNSYGSDAITKLKKAYEKVL